MSKHDKLLERLALLRERYQFVPKTVYDIGANVGQWTESVADLYPGSRFVQFEATELCHPMLLSRSKQLDGRVSVVVLPPVVLGAQRGPAIFYETKDNAVATGNSFFREQSATYDDEKVIERVVQTETLDEVVHTRGLSLPQLAKLDTQGSELDILRGAWSSLLAPGSPCQVIILETKVLPYNWGAPDLSDTIEFMKIVGWRFHDVIELHYLPSGELNEIDVLFVRNGSALVKRPPY